MSKLFSIGLEVEEVAVGRVLRQLDMMAGVAKINLNLAGQRRGEIADEAEAGPVRALAAPVKQLASPVKERQIHRTSDPRGRMDQAMADALKGGELHGKQIGVFLQRRGFSPNSLASQLNRMFTDRYIERGSGLGYWKLTPAGRKQFLGDQKNPSPVSNKPNNRGVNLMSRGHNNSQGIRRLVLDLLRDRPRPQAEVVKALVDNGKSAKSLTGPVYDMRATDRPALIVRNNNGVFSLTPHGKAEIDKIIKAEQSQQSPQSQAAE